MRGQQFFTRFMPWLWPLLGNLRQRALSLASRLPLKVSVTAAEAAVLRRFIRTDTPTILDVGANVGYSIRHFMSLFPSAVVHAFEPDPDVFQELRARLPVTQRLILNNVGIGDQSATLTLYRNSFAPTNSFLRLNLSSIWARSIFGLREAGSAQVPVTTLDQYCEAANLLAIDILKIDTQGFEERCLRGARRLLQEGRVSLIKIEIIFGDIYGETSSFYQIEQHLHPCGYRLFGPLMLRYSRSGKLLWADVLYVHNRLLQETSGA